MTEDQQIAHVSVLMPAVNRQIDIYTRLRITVSQLVLQHHRPLQTKAKVPLAHRIPFCW
jgi:hypothetical protein